MNSNWHIQNASIPGKDGRWSISISNGLIAHVSPDGGESFEDESCVIFDAQGRLVSTGFVDPHVHLDKVLTQERSVNSGVPSDLETSIRAVRLLKQAFTVEDVAQRAQRALSLGLAHGTTTARTHCEVDRYVEQRAVQGVLSAATAMHGRVDLQVIAFPQEGWFETPGSIEDGAGPYVEAAIHSGIKIVGGNINACLWPSDPQRQVDETFALAKKYNCDIDYHLDNWDGKDAFTLPYVAEKTISQGWQGRVAVSHIASLSHVSHATAAQTMDRMVEADIQVCVLPTRIRLTRVLELMEAGVNVSCGTDNMQDPFVRFGDADPLKAMLLLAQLTNQLNDKALERIWLTMTQNSARMLRLPNYGFRPGDVADLVVFDAYSAPQAILLQASKLAVIKNGVQVYGPLEVGPAHR